MKKISIINFLMLPLSFFMMGMGCSSGPSGNQSQEMYTEVQEDAVIAPAKSPEQEPARKIVKHGEIRYEHEHLNEEIRRITSLTKSFEGYISRENQSNNDYRQSVFLTIRVPSAHFDTLMNSIAYGAPSIEHKNIIIDDVTKQYYDLETRLATKKDFEKRYRELLAKANEIKEILEIENELRKIREEIEVMEGQFKLLNNQIGLSSIEVEIYYTKEILTRKKDNYGKRFIKAFQNGLDIFMSVLIFIANLWLLIILGLLIFVGIRYFRRKQKGKPRKHSGQKP